MTVMSDPRLAAWYSAARPRTLTATYVPLGLAAVIALDRGIFDPVPFLLALIGALLLQVGAFPGVPSLFQRLEALVNRSRRAFLTGNFHYQCGFCST